ncbi:MAG: nucleoside hydrolase [Cyanobacteria bacterium RU_5_0]|nr:nucleoside hydrolase [Cyanobacteria bacterium RU_5_0]
MTTNPIIIDCDPGVDDAIALLLAFASAELDVLGITTVAGNVPLSLTQTNARKICELAGRSTMRVYAGCPRPMLRSLETAEYAHGTTGLQGTELPEPTMPLQAQHGVDFLIETLMQSDGDITLATLGPLTNLAIALIKAPQITPKIREVVMMGGAITHGNVTPLAEFNIYVDPHAAQVVFSSTLKLTIISLDVTHQVLTTPDRLEKIRSIGTPVSQAAADLLAFYGSYDIEKYGMPGSPLHDPCVIAYLIQPDLFTGREFFVDVETTSDRTIGCTIVDLWQLTGKSPNVNVIQTVNVEKFYELLIDRLSRYV